VKVAVPRTAEPLLGSRAAFADAGAAAAADADVPPLVDDPPLAQLRTKAPAAPRMTDERILIFILSSLLFRWETIHRRGDAGDAMKYIPPVETSRLVLFGLVAAGVIVMITSSGRLADFAGGFAVGAGAVLVISRARRPAEGPPEAGGEAE
jgi:hypothetical protein